MTAQAKLQTRIKKISTPQLKEVIQKAMTTFVEGADIVFNACLNELQTRIPEKEFVTFCNNL